MASPSWLPTWPSGWPDLDGIYKRTLAGMVPRGLYSPDSEAWADWKAVGESLAQVRKLVEWILRSYTPPRDSEGFQISKWEALLALGNRGTIALRQAWATARIRQRGTMTVSLAKAIMGGAWGETDGSFLSIHVNDPADLIADPEPTDDLTRREQQYMHFYPTAEDEAPDWGQADDLIARAAPTWAYWTVGRYDVMKYDDADSGWDRGRWSN